MKFERMQEIEEDLFEQIRSIRRTKGREYATDEDTLADFKEVAAEAGISPLQCWATYVKKHERAIDTFIREGEVKSEAIEGRILDVIVYHLLLLGLVEDLGGKPSLPTQLAAVDELREPVDHCQATYVQGPGQSIQTCVGVAGHEGPHGSVSGTVWD
jgi:hypothetical protein